MKTLLVAVLALLTAALQPAQAAQWRDFGRGGHFQAQAERERPGGFQRQQPHREFRRPERQPERDYRQPERRDGRLTDEERRDLRRDLDRANREIYKGR